MPLIKSARQHHEVQLPDFQEGDTVIRRIARMGDMHYSKSREGVSSLTLQVEVTFHAAAGDGVGAQLTAKRFMPYPIFLKANNDTIVDAETGAILAIRDEKAHTPEQFEALANEFSQPVMLQGDYFEMASEQPVIIAQLIVYHMNQAAQMPGRYD